MKTRFFLTSVVLGILVFAALGFVFDALDWATGRAVTA
jgi:hypothetical protein